MIKIQHIFAVQINKRKNKNVKLGSFLGSDADDP